MSLRSHPRNRLRSECGRRGPGGRSRRPLPLQVEGLEGRTLLTASSSGGAPGPLLTSDAGLVPGEILVQFKAGTSAAVKAEARGRAAAVLEERIETGPMRAAGYPAIERLSVPHGLSVAAAVHALKGHSAVQFAEPNQVFTLQETSNDPHYTGGSLWGMEGDGTSPANPYGSQAGEAWAKGNTGSSSVYVGIIDEGVQFSHPDLAPNFWTNPLDPADGVDNDANGYVDDVHGWDFANNDSSVYDGTGDDHGTHVAGTIGAVGGNGIGVAGVNWQVTMISAKIFDATGNTTTDKIIKAFDYFTDLKVRKNLNIVATNNSWGGNDPYSPLLHDAVIRAAKADILTIAGAGNGGADSYGDNNDLSPFYPANFDTTQGTITETGAAYDAVISVTAIDSSGSMPNLLGFRWANYGATTVDLGAPGSGIVSTIPGGYGSKDGTSMAAPHVTGAAALYAAMHPGVTARQIRAAILDTARATPTPSLSGKTVTGGRLNVGDWGPVTTGPMLTINDVTVNEGNSGTINAVFTVTLSAASAAPVTVNFATANGTAAAGSDYTSTSGTLTIPAGSTSGTIAVPVLGDSTYEPGETFSVILNTATNASIADGQGTGTIGNDDPAPTPAIAINDVTVSEGDSGTITAVFTVSLSAPSTRVTTVQFATSNGSAKTGNGDYLSASGTVTFNPGETSRLVSITVKGDTIIEPNESFFVNLSRAKNATIQDGQGLGTIVNDDSSALTRLAEAGEPSPSPIVGPPDADTPETLPDQPSIAAVTTGTAPGGYHVSADLEGQIVDMILPPDETPLSKKKKASPFQVL